MVGEEMGYVATRLPLAARRRTVHPSAADRGLWSEDGRQKPRKASHDSIFQTLAADEVRAVDVV